MDSVAFLADVVVQPVQVLNEHRTNLLKRQKHIYSGIFSNSGGFRLDIYPEITYTENVFPELT